MRRGQHWVKRCVVAIAMIAPVFSYAGPEPEALHGMSPLCTKDRQISNHYREGSQKLKQDGYACHKELGSNPDESHYEECMQAKGWDCGHGIPIP